MQDLALQAPRVEPPILGSDILAIIADSVICADDCGRILIFNRAAEQTFGYSADEVLGHHVEILLPRRHRAQHVDKVHSFALGGGAASRLMGHQREVCGQRKNGEEFPAEATVSRQTVNGRMVLTVAVRDITERRALEEQREAIAREMDHRIGNVFSVVNSLVRLSARHAASIGEFKDTLLERLAALARTQNALRFGVRHSTRLSEVLLAEMQQYRTLKGENVTIEGPAVCVSPSAAQSLALAFHELATNSAKYGALSHASGCVAVTWGYIGEGDGKITIEWRETKGPVVKPPMREGFGTTLIKQVIERAFRADVTLDYPPEGLVCRMTMPRAAIEAFSRR